MTAILILGGTGEAVELAKALAAQPGLRVISALAGRTREPKLPAGEVRVGGFGGARGLGEYLRQEKIEILVNATHPFAAEISANALEAARETGVKLLRLLRPPWPRQMGDRWIEVQDAEGAAEECRRLGGTILLTLGRKDLARFAGIESARFIVRAIEAPNPMPMPHGEFVPARGPFELPGEIAFLRARGVTLLVAKQSGGDATRAKIDAARALGVTVVMIERPPIAKKPGCDAVLDVAGALAWVGDHVANQTRRN